MCVDKLHRTNVTLHFNKSTNGLLTSYIYLIYVNVSSVATDAIFKLITKQ
jgi:hypothetical protein